MKEVLWFAHPRFIFMTLHFLLFLTPTLTPTNKKLRVAINQKITGLKLEYTNLNSLQFHMEDLPFIKLVNLYLIENLSLNDQRILLMKRRFPKIRFKIHFICDIDLELDENELKGICIENWYVYSKRLLWKL